jgi:hypothetical protein
MEEDDYYIKLLIENREKMAIPGGLMSKQGALYYVGGMHAITGTLFFKDAHTAPVRETMCACFDEYEAGEWEFYVNGWQARMGTWSLCSLFFSMPMLYVEEYPQAFRPLNSNVMCLPQGAKLNGCDTDCFNFQPSFEY